jgi:hypothetical protein
MAMNDRSAKSATDLIGVTNSGLLQHPMRRHVTTINRGLAIAIVLAGATLAMALPAWAAPFVQGPDCAPGTAAGVQPDGSPGTICIPLEVLGIKPTPHNAVSMTLKNNGLSVHAVFINTQSISGQCHYDAQDVNGLLPGVSDDFAISGHGLVNRTYLAPPPLTTYHATVSCTGTWNGQDIEFGNTSQDVSG